MAKSKEDSKEDVKAIVKEVKVTDKPVEKPAEEPLFDARPLAKELGVPEYAIHYAKHALYSTEPEKIRSFIASRKNVPFRISF